MLNQIINSTNTPVADTSNLRGTYDGITDDYGEIRLRLGVIDNPNISRTNIFPDPINPKQVINMVTGKVTVKWLDGTGGIVGYAGDPKTQNITHYGNINDDSQSDNELIALTHPMMWVGIDKCKKQRWCGFNYMPPLGSLVIVGFRKAGQPILLGYVQTDFSAVKPIKLGEIMIKGYGNNYTYWTMYHRMEHKAWFNPNDIMNYNCDSPSPEGRTFTIVLDAEEQYITLSGVDTTGNSSNIVIRPEDILISSSDGKDTSSITISPGAIKLYSTGTIETQAKQNITETAEGQIVNKAAQINLN